MDNLQSIAYVVPELVLTGFIILVISADLIYKGQRGLSPGIALTGLLVTLAMIGYCIPSNGPSPIFLGIFAYDHFSLFFKVAFVLATLMVVLFSIPVTARWTSGIGEYYTLLLACLLGMCLMAGANDLLMMYLALEFVSITSYILAGLLRHSRKSSEASLKYIIYGAAASGVMIYGMSYLYGLTGHTNILAIGDYFRSNPPETGFILLATVLIIAGFGYKIAAVPFHMWCPDVYEGAPTPITAFFSVGPKAAGFAMFARFISSIYPGLGDGFEWQIIIAIICVLTMGVGNFCAIHQDNLKRLMAYSSIAHAGYMLLAFILLRSQNIASLLFYIIVYLIMNLGAFLVIIILEERFGVETVQGCRGVGWDQPVLCTAMAIFLFSLTGLPPLAGFIGKLLIFSYVIQGATLGVKGGPVGITLVVAAVLFSVISLYYYARVIGAMFLAAPAGVERSRSAQLSTYYNVLLWVLAIPTILLGIFWNPLYLLAKSSAIHLLARM
jgi:NADH-quinone oxidoreductase subunit N